MSNLPIIPILLPDIHLTGDLSALGNKIVDTLHAYAFPFMAPLHAKAESEAELVRAKGRADVAAIDAMSAEETRDLRQRATEFRAIKHLQHRKIVNKSLV